MAYIGKQPNVNRLKLNPQSSDPSNPEEGDFFYSDGTARAEGLWVYKNGIWEEAGSASGGINYIDNNDAEGATTGWSTYDDGASSTPVDGTGGSPSTVTFTRNTSSPLRGIADFDLAKSAADGQGEGVSYDFTIDSADTYSILRVSFDYTVSANFADADMGVYIYDVTNGAIIRMSKEDIDASSQPKHFVSEFQATDSTSYRLIFHIQSTNASAYDLNFDNVVVGPRSITKGPVVTDWQSFSMVIDADTTAPTKGSITSEEAFWRRVGDSMEIKYTLVTSSAGTAGSGSYRFQLPSGYTIDTNKISSTSGDARGAVGIATVKGTANSLSGAVRSLVGINNALRLTVGNETSAHTDVGSSFFGLGLSSTTYSFQALVPIAGWSSNSTISEDFGGREITVRGQGNGGTSITANVTNIDFTEVEDSVAAWNGTTFTAPETGKYLVSGMVYFTSNQNATVDAYIDGVQNLRLGFDATSTTYQKFDGAISLVKGEALTFRTNVSATLSNNSNFHYIHIQKFSTPQTLIGSEKNLIQTKILSADQTSNGTISDLTFNNLRVGTWYEITGKAYFTTDAGTADPVVELSVVHDGSTIDYTIVGINETSDTSGDVNSVAVATKFQATATSVTFVGANLTANSYINGNNTRSETYMQLEQRNDLTGADIF